MTSYKLVRADITLDGNGLVTLDGGNATTWEVATIGQQELRELNVIGLGFVVWRGAELTLRHVHLSGLNGLGIHFAAVYLVGSLTESATLNLIDSTIEDNSVCAVWGGE